MRQQKIYYWSPFLSNIATVDAVVKSINCIKKYDKEKRIIPYLIDSAGEWRKKKDTARMTRNQSPY